MTIKVTVEKDLKGSFNTHMQNLFKVDGQGVEVGHFEEQGRHPSGKTYVELMRFHHTGDGDLIPPRPVITILENFVAEGVLSGAMVESWLIKWTRGRLTTENLLKRIGRVLGQAEQEIFGDTSRLTPNSPKTQILKGGRNTPLVDTGDLREAVSYKTSISGKVRNV